MAWMQEIYDTLYDPNTICVACISHGKDSLAMLRAIKLLGLPLHRIVTSDVWATQDIPADLPPMWEWKKEADKIIKAIYGIEVEHICAMQKEKYPISEERKTEVEAHASDDLSQFVQVERESRTREESATSPCSTISLEKTDNTLEPSRDFLSQKDLGAKNSNLKKLTYEDIFYRKFKESRKEGRKEGRKAAHTALQRSKIRIAEGNSKLYGFARRGANWCTSYLKPPIRISDLSQTRAMVPTPQTLF